MRVVKLKTLCSLALPTFISSFSDHLPLAGWSSTSPDETQHFSNSLCYIFPSWSVIFHKLKGLATASYLLCQTDNTTTLWYGIRLSLTKYSLIAKRLKCSMGNDMAANHSHLSKILFFMWNFSWKLNTSDSHGTYSLETYFSVCCSQSICISQKHIYTRHKTSLKSTLLKTSSDMFR